MVWPAIWLIKATTSPIRCATVTSPVTSLSDFSASSTAALATRLASVTCRLISLTEEESCSEADAALDDL
ncbi:hypothetical protein CWO89_12890 [Bradyrhizobium sp. Leo170]|nr:hypothetical protein CWO89_12890 [Bradyrhizobium sp. Leo170]